MTKRVGVDWRAFFTFNCPACGEPVTPSIPPEEGDPWICHSCCRLGEWKRRENGR